MGPHGKIPLPLDRCTYSVPQDSRPYRSRTAIDRAAQAPENLNDPGLQPLNSLQPCCETRFTFRLFETLSCSQGSQWDGNRYVELPNYRSGMIETKLSASKKMPLLFDGASESWTFHQLFNIKRCDLTEAKYVCGNLYANAWNLGILHAAPF